MKEIYISGKVVRGNKRGGQLGFPTANIVLNKKIEKGVYGGEVELENKKYSAVIFVGRSGKILEAHLLGFEGDLYGKKITVKILNKIRGVMDFKDDEELKGQIEHDIIVILSPERRP